MREVRAEIFSKKCKKNHRKMEGIVSYQLEPVYFSGEYEVSLWLKFALQLWGIWHWCLSIGSGELAEAEPCE